jgi:hypothetical protein
MAEEEVIKVESTKPPEDAEEWLEYVRREERGTLDRLEDAAKFLATMISVSLTIFASVTKAGNVMVLQGIARIALVAWLLSLLLAFLVLFPFRYRFISFSVKSIKAKYRKIVHLKWGLLISSTLLFLAALTILVVLMW